MNSNKNRIVGIALAVLMLLALLNNVYFFLVILKLNIGQWLAFNACSLAIIIYLICFILSCVKKDPIWLSITLFPMYYYGTMGLVIMPWNEANLFAHITHIVITINAIWAVLHLLKEYKLKELGKTLFFSMLVFVPVFALIQTYNQKHIEEFMQVLQSM